MTTISIQKATIEKYQGLVMLPIREYQKLLERTIPSYCFTGKEAEKLDKLAEKGLKEYRAGKTKKISSLADLD